MYLIFKVLVLAALNATAYAHMSMVSPCSRFHATGENCPSLPAGQRWDDSMNSPISTYGSAPAMPLCKYTVPFDTPSATWTAGQSVTVKFSPHAAGHGGGHCQFSLSYDGGKTFVVVHDVLRHCFYNGPSSVNQVEVLSYTFTLPQGLPSSDKAVFAWSWVNAIGNREFYMNCADVAIKGSSGSYTGKEMAVVNYGDTPLVPEFNGNYETGLEHYNKKNITVTGSGVSTAGTALGTKMQQKNQKINSNATSASGTAASNQKAAAPTNSSEGSRNSAEKSNAKDADIPCTDGTFQCSGPNTFDTCDHARWVSRSCAPGTTCKITAENPNPCQ